MESPPHSEESTRFHDHPDSQEHSAHALIKIPAATITFSGTAEILSRDECPADVWQAVYRSADETEPGLSDLCMVAITPEGHFLTYGVGVSLMDMRHPELARARVPIDTAVATPANV